MHSSIGRSPRIMRFSHYEVLNELDVLLIVYERKDFARRYRMNMRTQVGIII